MSQEYNSTKRYRRARTQKNRPVLVTGNESIVEEQMAREAEPIEETPEIATEPEPTPTQPARGRRLPNFFSTVGKSEKEESKKETDVVQARLARATKGKASAATGKTAAVADEEDSKGGEKVTATPATRPATRPNQTFKTRYILGIAIYLFAANFIGTGITVLLNQMHADAILAQFSLFGGPVTIRTSTLLFLALLIIILVLLAKFDLIPRSLTPAATPQQRSGRSGETTPRQPTQAIRQGVKGEDDDLYQEYRLSQRRSKKR